ncbi:MAG TPA: hypothetical protein VF585_00345 [Chthoniobacterales bacterium]|jgi:uncharacterized metal-binding protein YceD (DUF177 family)
MKVHLNQIPPEGLHLEGDEDHDILEINDELIKPVSPVHYSVDVGLSEGGLFATGRLSVGLEMECVRCLQKFERTFEFDEFATQLELTGAEMIDLTPAMREDILLALPTHPHCDWDGETICPGVRFTPAVNNLTDEIIESDAPKAWDALDQLQIRPRS